MSKIRIRRCDFIIFAHICRRIKPNIDAIVYARYAYRNGALSRRLILAKSKIAPLKAISIPRMELMSAIVGLRLSRSISTVLGIETSFITNRSDSMKLLR